MRKTILGAALVLVCAVGYFTLWPVEIDPVGWKPPALHDDAPRNNALASIERLVPNEGIGPEGISLDAAGRIYAGYTDGRIVRVAGDGKSHEVLGNTGGRPWGTCASASGDSVLVADAIKGLLQLSGGELKVLADAADGVPFKLTDDVTQAASGEVFFTDASSKFDIHHMMADVFEHGANGRLLKYDPATKKTQVLMSGLHVANGVTMGPDDSFVLVAETLSYRVWRYWLKGPKAGQSELFIENLPGFPDNISYNGRDGFWLALFAPRDPVLDAVLPYPALLKAIYRIPEKLQPKAKAVARVLKLDLNGKVVADLQDSSESAFAPITSVREREGMLYFGSISYPAAGRMPVPATAAVGH